MSINLSLHLQPFWGRGGGDGRKTYQMLERCPSLHGRVWLPMCRVAYVYMMEVGVDLLRWVGAMQCSTGMLLGGLYVQVLLCCS